MSFVLQMGRIDILVMIFTFLVLDALIPDQHDEKRGLRLIFVLSFLLMFTGIYTIPLLFLIVPFVYFYYRDKSIFRKKVALMFLGFIFSFVFVCIYYFKRGVLLEFLYTYFQFNSVLTQTSEFTASNRILSAYFLDPEALIIFVLSVIFWCFLRKDSIMRCRDVCLLAAIPLLMIVSGRYMHYYAWIFYVPVCAFFVHVCSLIRYRAAMPLVCLIALVACFARPFYEWKDNSRRRREVQIGREFVKSNEALFREGVDVVLVDPIAHWDGRAIENIFYYPLIQYKVHVYRRDVEGLEDAMTFNEKLQLLVSEKIYDVKWKDRCVKLIQKLNPTPFDNCLPRRGVLLARNKDKFYKAVERLSKNKADVRLLEVSDEVYCAVYNKREDARQ